MGMARNNSSGYSGRYSFLWGLLSIKNRISSLLLRNCSCRRKGKEIDCFDESK